MINLAPVLAGTYVESEDRGATLTKRMSKLVVREVRPGPALGSKLNAEHSWCMCVS